MSTQQSRFCGAERTRCRITGPREDLLEASPPGVGEGVAFVSCALHIDGNIQPTPLGYNQSLGTLSLCLPSTVAAQKSISQGTRSLGDKLKWKFAFKSKQFLVNKRQ
jgi:hypothetical protein